MPIKKQSLRRMIQASNSASLDVPAPTLAPEMDLHAPNPARGSVAPMAETNIISYGEPYAPRTDVDTQVMGDDTPTKVFTEQDMARVAKPPRKRLTDKEARAQAERIEKSTPIEERSLRAKAEATFNPGKTVNQLAMEDAERILGRKPMTPPVTGAMEGQPVAQTVDRRGSNLGREAGERRVADAALKRAVPQSSSERFAGRIAAADTQAASAKAVIATPVATEVGTAATDFASRLGGALGRRAYGEAGMTVAGAAGKGLLTMAKGSVQPLITMGSNMAKSNAATKATLEALSTKGIGARLLKGGWARGANIARIGAAGIGGVAGMGKLGAGALADLAALEFVVRMGQKSTSERAEAVSSFRSQLADYQKQGSKYGFDVTGREGGAAKLQLKALVGADPKIEVKDNPTLRARYEAENKKRIRALIRSGAVHPVATSRPVIKGRSDEY